MKQFATAAIVAAVVSMTGVAAMAQDSAKKMEAKGAMSPSAQDCKDHANTATGQKRNDTPANSATDTKCAEMKGDTKMMKGDAMKKGDGMKKDADTAHQAPAPK